MANCKNLVMAATVGMMASWGALGHAGPPPNAAAATLFKGTAHNVYMVVNGQKRWVIDAAVFDACGLSFANVVVVPDASVAALTDGGQLASAADCKSAKALPAFANGALIQGTGPKVYLVSGGVKHWVTTSATFTGCGLSFANVVKYPDGVPASVPDGADITTVPACTAAKTGH